MQNMINKPAVLCAEILRGVAELAHAAAAAYGNGKSVQYLTSTGDYASAGSFAELLERASFEKRATARAAAMLRHAGVPQHGVKTALILLDALLSRGTQAGCTEEDWRKVGEMLGYASDCLEQIAAENSGRVVGCGLTLLTLCRPLRKYGREHHCPQAAGVLTCALEQPLLKLAEAAGRDGYEVYERVKALAPNQFFSLNQVGIERSIQTVSVHTDYIRVGLDPQDENIKDLCAAGRMVDVQEVRQMLDFVGRALAAVLDTAAVID